MTNAIAVVSSQALTPSDKAHVERLVWTEDRGRGWRVPTIRSSDLPVLRAFRDELEGRQVPADRVIIVAVLARLANHFRSERPADSWEMLFDDYTNDLSGISVAHIQQIANEHRREKAWFPKASELIERWDQIRHQELERLRRARVILGSESARQWEIPPPALGAVTP